ncbi:GGDEF domain-containing protein [Ideonella sp.]|uniref:GGDEF domain-containing protein n=1 Tax=Ideonella sp. TaxID=1929293 RepID=UPI002B4955A7|nr:GGDEF domain-containing protein [Ideonella sp.]HJV68327.1 GGDEF domain-containing protein [Ideonella sp.]
MKASPVLAPGADGRQIGDRAELEQRLQALCLEAPLSALALVMLELDGFERLVDRHGPQRAEECVQHVGVTLLGSLRRGTDHTARLEGPRFAVVLASTSLSAAQTSADALRRRIAGQVLSFDGRLLRLTATTAVCARAQGTRCGAAAMLQLAEGALARALLNQDCHVSVLAPSSHD